ncbi:TlpA family protein disulfide reductase [Shewanella psychropiezotolerans]|uniref:TlpA family protein disulfide reductase n=2 Tax=Shewanella psychropiezotolerans TaxID=2593655 RepID=A0ABX5WZV9_9GAMM|nr:TlpA family protein disulfide reductase [Shewanella psychropiezotolerans]
MQLLILRRLSQLVKIGLIMSILFQVNSLSAAPNLDLSVQDVDGQSYILSQVSGELIYIDFWASWCGPCRKSFPWMNEMHHKYADQGLKIIAINLDNDISLARQFLGQISADFIIAYDPDTQVAGQFDILGMPSSYLFNRQGKLVAKHVGFYSEHKADYEAEILHYLKQAKLEQSTDKQ